MSLTKNPRGRKNQRRDPLPPDYQTPADAPDLGATVTLNSREFIGKLLREYHENTKAANLAQEEAKRAFADAARFEQQASELDAKEQANLATIQRAQAELQQAQAERQQVLAELQEINTFTEKARTYGTSQTANRKGFVGQAADAKTVLDSFKIAIPEETDPAGPNLPTPGTAPMPVVPVDPTDERIDGSIANIDAAIAELPEKYQEKPL